MWQHNRGNYATPTIYQKWCYRSAVGDMSRTCQGHVNIGGGCVIFPCKPCVKDMSIWALSGTPKKQKRDFLITRVEDDLHLYLLKFISLSGDFVVQNPSSDRVILSKLQKKKIAWSSHEKKARCLHRHQFFKKKKKCKNKTHHNSYYHPSLL